MRLTEDEHRRGWLRWFTEEGEVTVSTTTVDAPDDEEVWSPPHTDPAGSIVNSPSRQFGSPRVHLISNVVKGLRILWERWTDQGIVTTVYDGTIGPNPVQMQHVINYGFSHRLVVSTSALAWPGNTSLRAGDVLIRLFTGSLNLERAEVGDAGRVESDATFVIEYRAGTFVAEGRLVEIIVPGASAEDAELRAYGLLGFLALILGENAVGEVLSSEPYEVKSALEQYGATRALFAARMPRLAAEAELDTLDKALSTLGGDDEMARATILALRWYEKGVRSDLPVDSLLGHLIGVEALVSAYSSVHGPVPEAVARREKWRTTLDTLKGKVGKSDRDDALRRFGDPSLPERFRFYLQERKLDRMFEGEFKFVRQARNDVVHGKPRAITFDDANRAEKLLRAILRDHVGVTSELPPDTHPRVRETVIHWMFDRSGQREHTGRQSQGGD